MAEQRHCRQCDKALPTDAPGGLCPECLLKVGLASESQDPLDSGGQADVPTASYGQGDHGGAKQEAAALATGQRFGGYQIVGRLGSGGMGTVYEADQLASGRRVALKVLGHRLDSPEAKQRFLREGRLAASVNHPNSVYVFCTEEIAGVPVIAMELVPGGTLEERVRRDGPLPVGEAVDAILQVIEGLEAAEAGGVLHRDVKPANCFVDREGTVKVGDFGLSISTSLRDDSNVTSDGTFLGTPAFCSPEQIRGDELDVRSDIYAVGVTLYYLLTGRMPFKAENLIRMIATVLEHPPKSPQELRPDIPDGLAQAVLRCLQKQPAARFKTYDELRQTLAPYGSSAPTPAALGLRLGAGVVNHLLWAPVVGCVMLASAGNWQRMSSPDYFGSLDHSLQSAIIALLTVLYFAVTEGLWGASPGKALCGLRVVNPSRNVAGLPRALVRAAVYVVFPQTMFLAFVLLIAVGVLSTPPMWLVQLLGYSWFFMMALMFSTARRQNGYAGFQDLVSNTRVVSKSVFQVRPVLSNDAAVPEETEEATPTVGPYHVLSSLDKNGVSELLLAYDTRLLRKIWIRTLPAGEPAVATNLRDLGRPGRLRWLAGKRSDDECWDAYEAPSGNPLVQLLKQPQPWQRVRYWLVDLAEEVAAGAKEQSLPAVLALDRIWITHEGRAKLLDFPAPDAEHHGVEESGLSSELSAPRGDDPASIGPFLNQVAISALEGRPVGPEEARRRSVAVPLPLQAKHVLDDLPTIEGPQQCARQLKPLLDTTASVSHLKRLGMLAICIAPIFLFAGIGVLGLSISQRWIDGHPDVVSLYHCVLQMEKLKRASGQADDAQAQQRRALDVYVAGRFAETISDPAVWSNSFASSLFSKNQRTLAERTVATHPNPAAEEVTAATAHIQPFLDKMPQELPGFPIQGSQMLFIAAGMAAGNLLLFVAIPSMICALLFRGGLLMYVFGIVVVTKDGSRASRLRTFWRSLVTWSPFVLLPLAIVVLAMIGLDPTMSVYLVLALMVALIAWSAWMPVRGIPDRLVGTYLVPR
jgi:uncharacterized RDD family membrane protein YckC